MKWARGILLTGAISLLLAGGAVVAGNYADVAALRASQEHLADWLQRVERKIDRVLERP